SSCVGKLPLRGRKPWRAVATSAGEQRPGNASHLVGKRYGHDLERSPCQELRQPGIFLRVMFGPPQHSVCPDHKNTPQGLRVGDSADNSARANDANAGDALQPLARLIRTMLRGDPLLD